MARDNIELFNRGDRLHGLFKSLKQWKLRPNSGSLLKDIVFILIICFIQTTILPSFTIQDFSFDLITPWLVITAVRQRALKATILTFIAALTLEMRSTVPAGMYLVSYWIFVNVIIQVRSTLSWRHQVPWLVTNLASGVWVHLFISFVLLLSRGKESFDWLFLSHQIFKVVTVVVFGLILCQEWLKFEAEEPVPQ